MDMFKMVNSLDTHELNDLFRAIHIKIQDMDRAQAEENMKSIAKTKTKVQAVLFWRTWQTVQQGLYDLKESKDEAMLILHPITTMAQITHLAVKGDMIGAIHLYRQAYGVSVKDAKDHVEAIRHEEKVCNPGYCYKCKDVQAQKDAAAKMEQDRLNKQREERLLKNWGKSKKCEVFYIKNHFVGRSDVKFDAQNYYSVGMVWARSLEEIFTKFNSDTSYNRRIRSMSVGDMVRVDGREWVCKGSGWEQVNEELPF